MYLAIVLLPLLGAILGAVIALAGARARFPGAEPSDDDHHARRMRSLTTLITSPAATTIIMRRPSLRPPAPARSRSSPPRC